MTFGQQRTCALVLCLPVSIYSESTFRFNTKMVATSGRCSISTTLRKKGDREQTIGNWVCFINCQELGNSGSKVMYRSNRSFNMPPPPGKPPGI